jgi:hypothetical protein
VGGDEFGGDLPGDMGGEGDAGLPGDEFGGEMGGEPSIPGEEEDELKKTNALMMEAMKRLCKKNDFKKAYALNDIRRAMLKEGKVAQKPTKPVAQKPAITEEVVNRIAKRVINRLIAESKAAKAKTAIKAPPKTSPKK